MGLVMVKKRPRRPAPELPDGDLSVESPPELPQPGGKNWSRMLMVLPMLAGSGAMMLMMMGSAGAGGGGSSMMMLRGATGGLFGVSMLGMMLMNMMGGSGPSKQEMLQIRRDYLRNLSQQRRQVHKTRRDQRRGLFYRHADPDALWSTVSSSRLWERRSGDGDFGVVRMGLGPQQLATPIRVPTTKPIEDLEPLCTAALRKFLETNAVVNDLPVAMDLRGFAKMYFRGDVEKSRALLRAMIAQIATWHSPDEMLIAVCASPANMHHWDWVKWLPHGLHPENTDALGQIRLMGNSMRELEERCGELLNGRPRFNPASAPWDGHHVIVIMDGGNTAGSDHLATEGGVEGVTILDLSTPPPRQLEPGLLLLQHRDDGALRMGTVDAIDDIRKPDKLSLPEIEALARQLSPLRQSMATSGGDDDGAFEGNLTFTDLLDIGDPYDYNPERAWAPRPNRDRLRVPIGVGPDGLPVDLDLKESAQDGMGPHGLMIGATGSGKSEALRTLVLALAAVHSPETLNFVLVDFKGGATFTRLDKLPHTSAVITNLSDELVLVDRMKDAIEGETLRRQELLRSAGKFASLREYEKARAAGAPIAPLPSLLIICDEFSELLAAKPDFIDMFVQIGRVGRSLGVHLLLASQRLEEGKLRGLDTHLSYRIGLRTFSAIESRTVLGVSDAYELPRAPGHGYMRFGTEPLIRFRASYVSGVYQRSAAEKAIAAAGGPQVREFTSEYVEPPPEPEPEKPETEVVEDDDEIVGDSLMDILVSKMEGKGTPAHQVWLPPLDVPPTLDELYTLSTTAERGFGTSRKEQQGALKIPVGLIDKPFEQRRDVQWLDLSGAAGHIAIAGSTQSGKSTLLRDIIGSLALSHTPSEAQIYCIDLGGGALSTIRNLPHVGAVYQRLDADEVRRTAAEVLNALDAREARFARDGIDSMPTYRKMRADGRVKDDPYGDIFLVVDGWQQLRQDFEDVEATVTRIAQRGLSYGVHVVAASAKWGDFRQHIRDQFGSTLELKITDAFDSHAGRKIAEAVPSGRPGRGITSDGLHTLAALPRVDGNPDGSDGLADGVEAMVMKIKDEWKGEPAPAVRLLPAKLPYERLPINDYTEKTKWKIPFGIAEHDLNPVYLDFDTDPHFIYISDVETGKTAFMRQLIKSITTRASTKEVQFVLFDYRRSLLGCVPPKYLAKYCSTAEQTTEMVKTINSLGKDRLPPQDITPQQLRDRSWWSGPEIFLLVDDLDLVGSGYDNPLLGLQALIPQARDIGLHIVVTRRAGGAARDLYGKFLGGMVDLATPAFQGSAPKSEGKMLGDMRASKMANGRGWHVTRKYGVRKVQTAWLEPEEI
ncbi:MAG TPA: type VII secretion protein EccCa [Candidatus Stackebrandtia faecavium]|nr:type VII secretion protein EccCa [Candidatus Stackebrandtia faecavium]